ncbi:MAG: ATP-binding protein [Endomicrobium sp.]|nr:ATP-binding protein [Endomicrobium sp.]
MLSYFRIQNYKSILDMKIDFSYAEGKAPNNYCTLPKIPFLEINKENRFIPSMAMYGPNASGKTNIIRAFQTYKLLIRKATIDGLYLPNKLNKKYNTTIFEIEFFIGKDKYIHFVEYDNNEIKKTLCKVNKGMVYEIDNSTHQHNLKNISTEEYDNDRITAILSTECSEQRKDSDGNNNYVQKKVFLPIIAMQYSGLNVDITNIYKEIVNNISVFGSTGSFIDDKDKVLQPTNNTFVEEASVFIRKFDIDISKIQLIPKKIPVSKKTLDYIGRLDKTNQKKLGYIAQERAIAFNTIDSYHKDTNNNEVIFDFFEDESSGTKVLFGLMYKILKVLADGKVLIIDEIDRSIHPLVFAKIIEIFKDKDYNTKNAQLVFTTHCTYILEADILRLSEVATVNKNLNEGSTIRRISDFKDSPEFKNIRNTTDLRKLYLQGFFKGIPFSYI